MKLACEVIKVWLVPYSEGSLRAHRPYLHAMVRSHLRVCAACRQDEVLLHRTAMALRRHQSASVWALPRGRAKSPIDVPLSSRVLQAIRDERQQQPDRRELHKYPIPAYATAVGLLCIIFAILTQPTGARPWFARYLFAHPHVAQPAKPSPVNPPYPMHDPFALPAEISGPAPIVANPQARSSDSRSAKSIARPAAWVPAETGRSAKPAPISRPAAVPLFDIQAQEAMTAAEAAERNRTRYHTGAPQLSEPSVPLADAPVAAPSSPGSMNTPIAPPATAGLETPGKGRPSDAVPAEFAHAGRLNRVPAGLASQAQAQNTASPTPPAAGRAVPTTSHSTPAAHA